MLINIKERLVYHLTNIPGKRIGRKIVVIESDDWGSIRMPSKQVFNKLAKKGYGPERDPYLKFDSLANAEDLSAIFEVLSCVKDKHQRSPIITANAVVANPDFKKIREAGYQQYFYEPFLETLKRYPQHKDSFSLWQEGINNGFFFPQFHGREHLNVAQWMLALQQNDKLIHEAFDNEMISISSMPCRMKYAFMEGMDFYTQDEFLGRKKILEEGLDLFEHIFKFKPVSFIANCYIWDDYVEEVLSTMGVKYLQGLRLQQKPTCKGTKHSIKVKTNFLGKRNGFGQTYLTRNIFFEPSHFQGSDITGICLKRIAAAFYWGKPAIISTHRVNFIGAIDENNRKINLKLFKLLLRKIMLLWPDVEFMTSVELGKVLNSNCD